MGEIRIVGPGKKVDILIRCARKSDLEGPVFVFAPHNFFLAYFD